MHSFRQDLRFALRQLRKSPGFTTVAVLTLALGIGAATAMFSVIYATVLRPLPFPDPNRIVYVETHAAASYIQPASWPGFQDERAQNQSFEYLAGFSQFAGVNVDTGSQVVHLHNTSTSDHFFDVLGVKPLLGRTFLPGEEQDGRNNVAVLSYEVWQQNFGGNPSAVGSSVHIDGFPYTVVGVMPAGFRFPLSMPNLIYTPLRISKELRTSRGDHWLQVIGRLKPGLTVEQAQADMNHVLVNLGRANPDSDKGRTARVMPLTMHITGQEQRQALWIMAAGVLFVLLIACVDVAVMLLARGVGRQREMAIRTALGAGRVRIVRQILLENLVLGLISAGVGLLLAWGLTMGMSHFLTKSFQRGGNIQLNWAVFLAAFAIAAISSLIFGLIPAKKMSSADPNRSLKSGASCRYRSRRLPSALRLRNRRGRAFADAAGLHRADADAAMAPAAPGFWLHHRPPPHAGDQCLARRLCGQRSGRVVLSATGRQSKSHPRRHRSRLQPSHSAHRMGVEQRHHHGR